MAAVGVTLKKGMKISEQELLVQGCRFVYNWGFTSKVFEKDNRFIYWDSKDQRIWEIR